MAATCFLSFNLYFSKNVDSWISDQKLSSNITKATTKEETQISLWKPSSYKMGHLGGRGRAPPCQGPISQILRFLSFLLHIARICKWWSPDVQQEAHRWSVLQCWESIGMLFVSHLYYVQYLEPSCHCHIAYHDSFTWILLHKTHLDFWCVCNSLDFQFHSIS